ncbi:CocE/NonD family hydrolase [Singulisphaera sp. Ch08]|uniref:CocE/NonD family hydrolase n=1 Tax=Singulisphaera sp. Ch08 TaxID=3120278 RepID=A0AAU7CI29_9BACT
MSRVLYRFALLLFLFPGLVLAQANRPPVPSHQDPVVQGVQKHINALCESHDERLAAIRDEAGLVRELAGARSRFLNLLDLDLDRPRLEPKVTQVETVDGEGYRIEKIVIEAAAGVPVPCSVYVPKSGGLRKPALLCPHGHSGRDRPVYQNAYQRLAKAGFIVLAKDGWGKQERRGTGHGAAGGQLALTGTELMALELFDNVRCIDYLLTRPDVDAERLGMAGLSGGGSQTLYMGAVENRLKAVSPTCAVTTFRSDLADTTMCVCELAHDVLTVGDHGLFLAMAYPRPVLVVNGTNDEIFPIAGARAAAAQARRLYAAAGRPDRIEFSEFDSPHTWSDAMIDLQVRWFRRQFGLPELSEIPPGNGPLADDRLRCFPEGDLPAGSLSLTQVNRSRMRRPSRETQPGDHSPAQVAELVRRRWSGEPAVPERVEHRDLGIDPVRNHRRERLSWASGLGGGVTATISRPQDGGENGPVILRLDRDRSEPELERLYWADRFRSYATVVDLSYTGQGLEPSREGQVGSALITAGRSLLAERVRDLLVTLTVLRQRDVVGKSRPLFLYGHGFDGVLLLLAAPLLPDDACLILDQTPVTYLAGAEADFSTSRLLAPPYHWTILPNLARDQDLIEVIGQARPRRILLTHPLDAAQQQLGQDELSALLGRSSRTDHAMETLTRERTRAEVFHRLNEVMTVPGR